jgi:hypothetical protein
MTKKRKTRSETPWFVLSEITRDYGWEYYKYYVQRYRLWSKYDQGVWMDEGIDHLISNSTRELVQCHAREVGRIYGCKMWESRDRS